ncbi:hypothetical protein [uncultured Friedmanniella sp.]|uniref:hypothetical protein n=1 Tax=uncultured Friedmanniella sp. TaxID=335381 RepID=UPI0035C966A7
MDAFSTAVGFLIDLLQIAAGVVGAVLVGTRVRPPARSTAVTGCLLLAASALVAATSRLALPALVQAGLDYPLLSILVSLGYGLPAAAGIGLLVRALLLASPAATTYPPYPVQSQYPQAQYPQAQYPQAQQPQSPYPQAPQGYGPTDRS